METSTRERIAAPAPAPLDSFSTAPKRRMLVIVNPHAATVSDRLRNLVVYALKGRYEVDAVDTEARGHATVLCREAAHEGYDVVVAFGGDGTVNEAANGLLGSTTPLCALPGGSANVFVKILGVPGDLIDATEHLLAIADDWHPRKIDLGVVNGRCFTFNSGVGLDASVVERVDARPDLKARFGPHLFTWEACRLSSGKRPNGVASIVDLNLPAARSAASSPFFARRFATYCLSASCTVSSSSNGMPCS